MPGASFDASLVETAEAYELFGEVFLGIGCEVFQELCWTRFGGALVGK